MSTFEVIRGVEGCCLVLDDTRIAGPKPWGGGKVIYAWETDEDYKAINQQNRWYKLFGTPERAAQMMIAVRNECEREGPCYPRCEFSDAPTCPSNCESDDYNMILEWLKGDAE